MVDNLLSQPEYVAFLNIVTEDRFPETAFKDLPDVLKQIDLNPERLRGFRMEVKAGLTPSPIVAF